MFPVSTFGTHRGELGVESWQILEGVARKELPTGEGGDDMLYGDVADTAHFSAEPVPPRYYVGDMGLYIIVLDLLSEDGLDILVGIPIENLEGP